MDISMRVIGVERAMRESEQMCCAVTKVSHIDKGMEVCVWGASRHGKFQSRDDALRHFQPDTADLGSDSRSHVG